MKKKMQTIVYGIRPVLQVLKAGQRTCYGIAVEKAKDNTNIREILSVAEEAGISVKYLQKVEFIKRYRDIPLSQGVVATVTAKETLSLEALTHRAFEKKKYPVFVLLDGVQDPQNLGAIVRSAEAFGVDGIVIPKRNACPLNETVAKCSAGALEWMPITLVGNLAQAMERMKQEGIWIVGVDMDGEKACHDIRFNMPLAFLLGGEGKGIRSLPKQRCDFSVTIPMTGNTEALNVSAASAILFYELRRQRKGV